MNIVQHAAVIPGNINHMVWARIRVSMHRIANTHTRRNVGKFIRLVAPNFWRTSKPAARRSYSAVCSGDMPARNSLRGNVDSPLFPGPLSLAHESAHSKAAPAGTALLCALCPIKGARPMGWRVQKRQNPHKAG